MAKIYTQEFKDSVAKAAMHNTSLEVAKMFGISEQTVMKYKRDYFNLPRVTGRPPIKRELQDRIISNLDNLTLQQNAILNGVCIATVTNIKRKFTQKSSA